METIDETFSVTAIISMEVPSGSERTFTLYAYDIEENVIYKGSTNASLESGKDININIELETIEVVPAIPEAPTLSVQDSCLLVSWIPVEGATYYRVYYSEKESIENATEIEIKYETIATIENLTNGTIYYVWIKAGNNAGLSEPSLSVNAIPEKPLQKPDIPEIPTISVTEANKITVEWGAVSGAQSYVVKCVNQDSEKTYETDTIKFTIEDLVDNREYKISICATNEIGASDFSDVANALTLPGRPTIEEIKANTSRFTVKWKLESGADEYIVSWNNTGNIEVGKNTITTENTQIEINVGNENNGKNIYLWVRATNSSGYGVDSEKGIAYPIAKPYISSIEAVANKVEIAWAKVAGATKYKLYYGELSIDTEATQCSLSDINLNEASFTVQAFKFDNAGSLLAESDVSDSKIYSSLQKPVVTLTALEPVDNKGRIEVNWNSNSNATSYNVHYSENNVFSSYQEISVANNQNSIIIDGLKNGTIYYIRVKAFDNETTISSSTGESDYSTASSIITPPIYPVIDGATPSGDEITVYWTTVKGALGYKVFYSESNNPTNATEAGTTADTNYTISGLSNGTSYYVWVKAYNNSGESNYSTASSITTLPDFPTIKDIIASGNEITVSWVAVKGALGYKFFYSENNNSTNATEAGTTADTNYTISDLSNGTRYYFWVKAYNDSGESNYSLISSMTTLPATPNITDITALSREGSGKISVEWQSVSATEYNIYYSTNSTKPATTDLTTTDTKCQITGLDSNTTYNIWVSATIQNREGNSSNMVSATTPLTAPENLSVTSLSNRFIINWNAITDATSYKVYLDDYTTPFSTATENSLTIAGLTYGQEYEVKITAVKDDLESNFSSAKTATFVQCHELLVENSSISSNSVKIAGSKGNYATIIGNKASNKAYFYTSTDGINWTLTETLEGEANGDNFGSSVDILEDSGKFVIAVGAPETNSGKGRVYCYEYETDTIIINEEINKIDEDGVIFNNFGSAVAINNYGGEYNLATIARDATNSKDYLFYYKGNSFSALTIKHLILGTQDLDNTVLDIIDNFVIVGNSTKGLMAEFSSFTTNTTFSENKISSLAIAGGNDSIIILVGKEDGVYKKSNNNLNESTKLYSYESANSIDLVYNDEDYKAIIGNTNNTYITNLGQNEDDITIDKNGKSVSITADGTAIISTGSGVFIYKQ